MVSRVVAGTLAESAGLVAGDVIKFANNQPVKTLNQFARQYASVSYQHCSSCFYLNFDVI